MPLYTYKCSTESCACVVDKIQKITDEPVKECPVCKEQTMVKQLNGGALIKMTGIRY
jgi:putative FmdB family regulatory protein